MIKYCDQCGKNQEYLVAEREESYEIRGEIISVPTKTLKCEVCGLELFDDELTGTSLKVAYNEYRHRKNIPTPEEIKELRSKFGLSLRGFAKMLGWGYITLHRYETGALPSEAHAAVLTALKTDPTYALGMLEATKKNFNENELNQLVKRIKTLAEGGSSLFRYEEEEEEPETSVRTGFVYFTMEKFSNMVLFFARNELRLLKTKLLKLLWYADFLHFKRYGVGISGAVYVHLPLGPVPDGYTYLLGELEKGKTIKIDPFPIDEYVAEHVLPLKEGKISLSEGEIETLQDVARAFSGWGSRRISEYSHMERAYLSTEKGEFISYEYALELSLK